MLILDSEVNCHDTLTQKNFAELYLCATVGRGSTMSYVSRMAAKYISSTAVLDAYQDFIT